MALVKVTDDAWVETSQIVSVEVASPNYNAPKSHFRIVIGLTNGAYVTVPYGHGTTWASASVLVDKIRDTQLADRLPPP